MTALTFFMLSEWRSFGVLAQWLTRFALLLAVLFDTSILSFAIWFVQAL